MKRRSLVLFGTSVAAMASAQIPKMDELIKGVDKLPKSVPKGSTASASDEKTNVAGIKEALAVGTERAVQSLSRKDGYFGNAADVFQPIGLAKAQIIVDAATDVVAIQCVTGITER